MRWPHDFIGRNSTNTITVVCERGGKMRAVGEAKQRSPMSVGGEIVSVNEDIDLLGNVIC
jgi:hypothetical protein